MSESVVKQIHYLVLADKKDDRGVYRRVPVRIMGASHDPVQPYLIQPKMEQLLEAYSNSTEHIIPGSHGSILNLKAFIVYRW